MKKKITELERQKDLRDWALSLAKECYAHGNVEAGKRWEIIARDHSDKVMRETRLARLSEKRMSRSPKQLHSVYGLFSPIQEIKALLITEKAPV